MTPRVATPSWLSVTPEPERELPEALATLACRGKPSPLAVRRERARIERLVVRGRQREWLAYLSAAVRLIDASAADPDPDPEVRHARAIAREVIANHHNLLLGLPGSAARRTAAERAHLQPLPRSSTDPDPRSRKAPQ